MHSLFNGARGYTLALPLVVLCSVPEAALGANPTDRSACRPSSWRNPAPSRPRAAARRGSNPRQRRRRPRPTLRRLRTRRSAGVPSQALLTAQQALAQINRTPGRRRHRAGRGLSQSTRRQHDQGRARLRARRVRAAEMGRRHPAVDPRLGPVAQFPSARRAALYGRHPDQHRRRLWRFSGDRSDRLQICRGFQGRQRAAVRRQFARRRDQFRDAERPRSMARTASRSIVGAFGYRRLQANAGGANGPWDGYLTASTQAADGFRDHSDGHATRVSGNVGYQISPDMRDAVLSQRQRGAAADSRHRDQDGRR